MTLKIRFWLEKLYYPVVLSRRKGPPHSGGMPCAGHTREGQKAADGDSHQNSSVPSKLTARFSLLWTILTLYSPQILPLVFPCGAGGRNLGTAEQLCQTPCSKTHPPPPALSWESTNQGRRETQKQNICVPSWETKPHPRALQNVNRLQTKAQISPIWGQITQQDSKGSCGLTRNKLAPHKKALCKSHECPVLCSPSTIWLYQLFLAFGSAGPGGKRWALEDEVWINYPHAAAALACPGTRNTSGLGGLQAGVFCHFKYHKSSPLFQCFQLPRVFL